MQQRLSSVLSAAGLKSSNQPAPQSPGPSANEQAQAKQLESAAKAQQAMTRAAEQLANQQRDILARASQMGKGDKGDWK